MPGLEIRSTRCLLATGAAAAFACGVGGCLPIPYTQRLAPQISGMLRNEGGAPIAGVRLAVSTHPADSSCDSAASYAITDSAGAFSFPELTQHHSWISLMEGVSGYRVCALDTGSRAEIYLWKSLVAPPRTSELRCTSSATPVPHTTCS